MFYEIFINLCNKKGLSPTAILQKLGVSTSKLTAWKKGSLPSASMLILISEFFEVSIDYLLTGKENKETKLTPDEQELLKIYGKLANEEKKEAVKRVEELTIKRTLENKLTLSQNSISKTNGYEQELLLNFRKLSLEEQMRLIGRVEVMAEMSKVEENIG